MLNHKQRQRENRKAKRRLKHQLKALSEINKSDIPVSIYKEQLDKSFLDYAVSETWRELHSENIELDRKVVLKKVILLKDKLRPTKGD